MIQGLWVARVIFFGHPDLPQDWRVSLAFSYRAGEMNLQTYVCALSLIGVENPRTARLGQTIPFIRCN